MNTLAAATFQVPSIISVPTAFAFLAGIITGMLIALRRR